MSSADPSMRTGQDLHDELAGDVWACWYCSRWGFVGDSDARLCEECGNTMCEECASVHECVWAEMADDDA